MNGLQFGEYTVDRRLRQLKRAGEAVPLPGKAFDLLVYMAENPGRPLTKSELLGGVWPDSFVEESNLSQNVFLLRKALGQDGPIVTLPGRGYQFAAQVREAEQPAEQPAEEPAQQVMAVAATRDRMVYKEQLEERIAIWRSPLVMGLLVVGGVAIAAAGWLGWQRYEDRVGGPPVQVVMADVDGGTGDAVLDHALRDVLRIELAQSPFLTVVPAATVRQTMVQMLRQADDPVPLPVAREVCERTGSQAVVQEHVARIGSGFLVTEEATNCADSSSLADVQQQVDRPEQLPRAIDKMADTLRHSLGESRRTIARFSGPLRPMNTSSLEALEIYTETGPLGRQGKFAECIQLLKRAVALDPRFASAWLDLSTYADNSLDRGDAKIYLQKAYDLRDNSTEPVRLLIVARYNALVTGDLYESERNYKGWIAIYPRQVQPWSGLTNLYREMGRNADLLTVARRTLELAPTNTAAYQSLADAQIRNEDPAGARATLDVAMKKGFDGQNLRYLLLRVGMLQHDMALVAEQEAWAREHPDSPILLANLAQYAQNAGKMNESDALLDRMDAAFQHLGSPEVGTSIRQQMAFTYLELGEVDRARKCLLVARPDAELDTLLAMAAMDETAAADALLKTELAARPQDTVWHQFYAPAYRAQVALIAGRPRDALAELEHARAFDFRSADLMYLRGQAYLQAGMLPEAEGEFRRLLANPGIEATAYQLPLAQVELARTLAREGNSRAAAESYANFLAQWKQADPQTPLLQQVRREAL